MPQLVWKTSASLTGDQFLAIGGYLLIADQGSPSGNAAQAAAVEQLLAEYSRDCARKPAGPRSTSARCTP